MRYLFFYLLRPCLLLFTGLPPSTLFEMRVFFSLTLAPLLAILLQTATATPFEDVPIGGEWIQSDKKTTLVKRNGKKVTVFEHKATQSRLEYVSDSGICETTKGVKQHSGYLSVGEGMNMWFWFFEARKDAANAPLTAWFNGGPGCSSMIGLFQEHGPCQFYNNANTPTNNKYSWNEYSNMIYIDQPVGVGFSYGNNNVSSTNTASPYVWKLIQNFYANFPEYKSRDFGIFTESYGGHYGQLYTSHAAKSVCVYSYFQAPDSQNTFRTRTGGLPLGPLGVRRSI